MSMKDAKVNYALKSLIEKYIQEHSDELKPSPDVIDPTNMVQVIPAEKQIPIAHLQKLKIETFSGLYDKKSMLITIKPLLIPGRLPVSIIALIDISESMLSNTTLSKTSHEDTYLSLMQLVQYSLKTIISVLGPSDRITLITFQSKVNVVMEGVKLDDRGKKEIMNSIDKIIEQGKTNIWDALDKGIDQAIKENKKITAEKMVKKKNIDQINTSILLFTDGQSNINPLNGIIHSLKKNCQELSIFIFQFLLLVLVIILTPICYLK